MKKSNNIPLNKKDYLRRLEKQKRQELKLEKQKRQQIQNKHKEINRQKRQRTLDCVNMCKKKHGNMSKRRQNCFEGCGLKRVKYN